MIYIFQQSMNYLKRRSLEKHIPTFDSLSDVRCALKNSDFLDKIFALRILPNLGMEAIYAIPDIRLAMTDDEKFIRARSIETFLKLAKVILQSDMIEPFVSLIDQTIPTLVGRFKDEDPIVRCAAAICFTQLRAVAIASNASSTIENTQTHMSAFAEGKLDLIDYVADRFRFCADDLEKGRVALTEEILPKPKPGSWLSYAN